MRTDEVQHYLADHLTDLLSDRLSSKVQSSIRAHMQVCPHCCGEMEDFEEIQSVLRSIPLAACDSVAMRARFDSFVTGKLPETTSAPPAPTTAAVPVRPAGGALRIAFAMLVLALAIFAFLGTGNWTTVGNVSHIDQALQPAKPIIVPEVPGVITGEVRTAVGSLARWVRVAVMAVPESETTPAMNLIRVDRTNDEGRFRLEEIPPGRYYVIAGSVDIPTYYPGTPNVSEAMIVSIHAGAVAEHIDFPRFVPALTIPESTSTAVKPAVPATPLANIPNEVPLDNGTETSASLVPVSVTVRLDSGERLPYKPDMSIVFTGSSGATSIAASSLVGNLFQVSVPANDSYSVTVSEIASGYEVLSIDSGTTDLMHGDRFTPVSVPSSPLSIVVTLTKQNN